MKKLAFILAIVFALFLVGCGDPAILIFDNKWSDGSIGYSETLVYDVVYDDDFIFGDYNFTKATSTEKLTMDVNGTYTVTNTIINSNNEKLPKEIKDSPILLDLPQLLVSTTELVVKSEYTFDGKTESYDDYLKTYVYYCSTDASLSPIYSVVEYDYTLVKLTDSVIIEKVKGFDSISYSADTYKVTQRIIDVEKEQLISEISREYPYTAKTLIDNASFFMAIRNYTFSKDYANYFSVVHPSYGQAQELQATYFSDFNVENLNLKVNGEDKENLTMPTKVIKYLINKTNQSGTAQLVFIQSEATSGVANKSIMVKYVSPLADYSNYSRLGAMVYTLSSVEYTK